MVEDAGGVGGVADDGEVRRGHLGGDEPEPAVSAQHVTAGIAAGGPERGLGFGELGVDDERVAGECPCDEGERLRRARHRQDHGGVDAVVGGDCVAGGGGVRVGGEVAVAEDLRRQPGRGGGDADVDGEVDETCGEVAVTVVQEVRLGPRRGDGFEQMAGLNGEIGP